MKPQRVLRDLRELMGPDDVLISDVGAHKLWVSRLWPAHQPNTVLISNGAAAMGFAVPAAIAAKLVLPRERHVVTISGDGGFLMNFQELETAKRLGLAIVNIVWTDSAFGVIEMHQKRKFGRLAGTKFDESRPGRAGRVVRARRACGSGRPTSSTPTLRQALELDTSSVVEIPIDYRENARFSQRLGDFGRVEEGVV